MKKEIIMEIGSGLKAVLWAFLAFLLAMAVVIFLFIGAVVVSIEIGMHTPPKNFYKHSLEYIANDTLPSLKVIKQNYKEERCAKAIIKLSASDYNKVLNAVEANYKVFDDPEHPLSLFYPDSDETKKLIEKANITYRNIAVKYEIGSTGLGFVPPDIIIYNKTLW